MIRTKTCPTCGTNFSYKIGKGKDRKHCGDICRVKHQMSLRAEKLNHLPTCIVPECEGKATRVSARMCEKHYMRQRRTGSLEARPIAGRYKTGAGYIQILMPGHEISSASGYLYEHRFVAYEAHAGVCPNCHWCGEDLTWPKAVVDHLNESKSDNRKENLVVTCNNCNRARGAMMPLVSRLLDSSLESFIRCIRNHHAYHKAKTAKEGS